MLGWRLGPLKIEPGKSHAGAPLTTPIVVELWRPDQYQLKTFDPGPSSRRPLFPVLSKTTWRPALEIAGFTLAPPLRAKLLPLTSCISGPLSFPERPGKVRTRTSLRGPLISQPGTVGSA